jgi:uncharacterized protein YecE (DUF72 family)
MLFQPTSSIRPRIDESGAKAVWAYFNNDRNGYAIKNARALSRLLGQ